MQNRIPPVVLNLIIINVLVWIAQLGFPVLNEILPVYKSDLFLTRLPYPVAFDNDILGDGNIFNDPFRPYQVVTYFFAHANFLHIFFNMFALYSLGGPLEHVLGSKRFAQFYLFSGLFAGVTLALLDPAVNPVLGASTAVSGVVLGAAFFFPDAEMILFPIPFPIRLKYLAMFSFALSVFMVFFGSGRGNVSHFGHLMGMVAALIWFSWGRLVRLGR